MSTMQNNSETREANIRVLYRNIQYLLSEKQQLVDITLVDIARALHRDPRDFAGFLESPHTQRLSLPLIVDLCYALWCTPEELLKDVALPRRLSERIHRAITSPYASDQYLFAILRPQSDRLGLARWKRLNSPKRYIHFDPRAFRPRETRGSRG